MNIVIINNIQIYNQVTMIGGQGQDCHPCESVQLSLELY
jgi:hypothetical protein